MKRSPLRRGKPLTAKTALKRKRANPAKKVSATTLRKKCDARLSAIVRRVAGACEMCERGLTGLQVHHLIGRRAMYYRYDPKNLLCVCGGCHMVAEQNPAKFLSVLAARKPEQYAWLQQHCHKVYPGFWKAKYYLLIMAWLDTIEECASLEALWNAATWQETDDEQRTET